MTELATIVVSYRHNLDILRRALPDAAEGPSADDPHRIR
jgi:hypothetical protein